MVWMLYIVCLVLKFTWRVRVVGLDRRRMAVSESPSKSFLLATFHENAVAGLLTHVGQNICVMASQSKDGEIVAFVCDKIGLKTVRGSSSRGGKDARDGMIDELLAGFSGAITVDGPRGPRRVPKNGIADIARKTGVPVVPISCVADSAWILNKTWDKTRIPKPFARVIVFYGEPIKVPKDLEGEHFQGALSVIAQSLIRDDDVVGLRFDELWSGSLR
jgi:lysophospholipid acyltransferase (LPLAT)-like uncharacterized protein